jgi:ElaA protein
MEVITASFETLDAATVYAVARLRQDVFVVEQACAYPDLDGRDLEPGTRHVLLREDPGGPLLGYVRVLDDGPEWRIGRMVLAPAARGRGLADRPMRAALEACAAADPGRDVVLSAQTPLASWYAGLGFQADGPAYDEDGIPHTPMRRPHRPVDRGPRPVPSS